MEYHRYTYTSSLTTLFLDADIILLRFTYVEFPSIKYYDDEVTTGRAGERRRKSKELEYNIIPSPCQYLAMGRASVGGIIKFE